MIELQQVSKTFHKKNGSVTALDNVSFTVGKGNIFGVIGASGAGKSTLIRCVNLLERPGSGKVIVDGKNLPDLSSSELARSRREMGMIFQHFNLLSSRTVYENIALPLELDKTPVSQIKTRVDELLALVGLEEKRNDFPSNLSGGQKQRVAIARALAARPKILLCDEATSALDPATTSSILSLLKNINRKFGITILLITHEMDVIKAICDEVAVISDGKLIEKGRVGDIFSNPSSPVTREFITSSHDVAVPFELEQVLTESSNGTDYPLVKLRFTGKLNAGTVFSETSRLFEVDNEIVAANMDYAQGIKFGVILILVKGTQENVQQAIEYYKSNNIQTEVLGYV